MAWGVGVAVVAGLLWIWMKLNGPVWNEIPEPATFTRMLRILMYRGMCRPSCQGTLTLCPRAERSRYLQFTKVIDAAGIPGFTASYARTDHTAAFYDAFKLELDRRGLPYREQSIADRPLLMFDFGQDIGGAYVTTQLLCSAWGVRLHDDCIGLLRYTLFENVPRLTGVDHPANPWLS